MTHSSNNNISPLAHHANVVTIAIKASLLLSCILISLSNFSDADQQQQGQQQPAASEQDFEQMGLHYGKYLKEVVAALDKDQKFTETIKTMDVEDIKSGKVAEQLKHVHKDVRDKLNQLKYYEIKRLRDLATRKNEIDQYGETYHGTDKRRWRTLGASLSQLPDHLGSHAIRFDTDDLHKLMVAATNDLEKIDKERREDFTKYEMEKEYQFQESLKLMNETQKQEAIKLRDELKRKHDQHEKVRHPGSQQQLEDVWVKKDHLPKEEFNPNTFFSLRDTDGNNYWDQNEVRLLLESEIQKLYDPNNPEDDPNEMEEEYNRMREHLYKEMDTDKDGLISRKEFLDYSHRPEFRRDDGWEDLSKHKAYTEKELEDYAKNRDKYRQQTHGYYNPEAYANYPQQLHLPNWGYGMPAGAHPSQYYAYQVDPNHPQAQQMMQQQQHMAYQQAQAYHQQAAYQQPVVNQQHAIGGQPIQQGAYQQPAQIQQAQPAQYQQQVAPVAQQAQYQPVQQQAPAAYQQAAPNVVQNQPQASFQQQQQQQQAPPPPPQQQQQPAQQQQAPPAQQPPQQQNFQQAPQQLQQQQQQAYQQVPAVQQGGSQPNVAQNQPQAPYQQQQPQQNYQQPQQQVPPKR